MSDFSQDIQNFQRYGTYAYKFDSVGNMIFNSSSVNFNQVYLAFPLQNVILNNSKVETMYNTSFEEFVPQTTQVEVSSQTMDNLQQQLDIIQSENESLKTQLDDLIIQNESSGSAADQMATKQVILELRKAVGQGRVDSDFSEDFPYTPIRKETI
jgi:hypothetical protein